MQRLATNTTCTQTVTGGTRTRTAHETRIHAHITHALQSPTLHLSIHLFETAISLPVSGRVASISLTPDPLHFRCWHTHTIYSKHVKQRPPSPPHLRRSHYPHTCLLVKYTLGLDQQCCGDGDNDNTPETKNLVSNGECIQTHRRRQGHLWPLERHLHLHLEGAGVHVLLLDHLAHDICPVCAYTCLECSHACFLYLSLCFCPACACAGPSTTDAVRFARVSPPPHWHADGPPAECAATWEFMQYIYLCIPSYMISPPPNYNLSCTPPRPP